MTLPLTPAERKVIGEYLRTAADKLGMRDWTINVEHAPSKPDLGGSVEIYYGRAIADIKLATVFRDYDEIDQRETLIHELLHIRRQKIRGLMDETLPELMGKPAYRTFYEAFRLLDEEATDADAHAIAGFFPRLELPKVEPDPAPVAP